MSYPENTDEQQQNKETVAMSQQPQYAEQAQYAEQVPQQPQYAEQAQYAEQVPQQHYYQPQKNAAAPTNTLAIIALIASFLLAPAGVICGHIALKEIRTTGENGRSLALAALIIGYIQLAILFVFIVIIVITLALAIARGAIYYY